MALQRDTIQTSSTTPQTFPMLVSLSTEGLKIDKRPPIDLVCVLDQSGSMYGEKIELLKNTFNYLLEYLQDFDRLSVITFSGEVSVIFPLTPTTQSNKEKLLHLIRTIQAAGSTDIYAGMEKAFQILTRREFKNPVSSIFLLSDGQDMMNYGRAAELVKHSLQELRVPKETSINTFGFGNDHDSQLMTQIANLREGGFYFIDQIDTIDEAFVDRLGGLMSSIAKDVQIKVKPEKSEVFPRIEIVKAYGDVSMWNFQEGIHTTTFANLLGGKRRDFVLELNVPETKTHVKSGERIKVASVEVEILGFDNEKIILEESLYVTLVNENEEFSNKEENNREVMKHFFRVKGAEFIEEARNLCENGLYSEAKELLKGFKEELENSEVKEEEFIQNLIKDIEIAIRDVDPVVYESSGKHNLLTNVNAQHFQTSNIYLNNAYLSDIQFQLAGEMRIRKLKK